MDEESEVILALSGAHDRQTSNGPAHERSLSRAHHEPTGDSGLLAA